VQLIRGKYVGGCNWETEILPLPSSGSRTGAHVQSLVVRQTTHKLVARDALVKPSALSGVGHSNRPDPAIASFPQLSCSPPNRSEAHKDRQQCTGTVTELEPRDVPVRLGRLHLLIAQNVFHPPA
jgi:hypothetical protein